MPGSTLPLIGNNALCQSLYASLTPAATVTTDASITSTYTIHGLVVGDAVEIYPQAAGQALLTIGSVWVSAADTLSVQWVNSTGTSSSGTPAALGCILVVIRCSNIYAGYANYPTNV
jgi:hypothetical protein